MKTLNVTRDNWYMYIPTEGDYVDRTLTMTNEEYVLVQDAFYSMHIIQEFLQGKIKEDDLASGC